MKDDRPLLGIGLMLAFCVLAPLGDTVSKLLTAHLPVHRILVIRFLLQVLLLAPVVWATGRSWRMSRRATRLVALRTAFHILSIACIFAALARMPLAETVAIVFIMPFILLIAGHFLFGEEVGPRRMGACAVGFIGTMMVIQPTFAEVGWVALLPVGTAVGFSGFMMTTRLIAKETDPFSMQAVSGLMASVVLVPLLLVAERLWPLPFPATPVTQEMLPLIAALGLLGTFGHLFMTWALRYAPGATLAPMQYLEIPIACLIGWIVFHDLPDGLALSGIAVTLAAGLYVILRERAIAARPPMPAPAAPAPRQGR